MDPERERIQADLRGLLEGEVRCDDIFVQAYASDASVFEIRPLGVVRPRSAADVVACVEYASDHRIPLHARGAGTGLAGESIGPGLVIDFSHSMRRILAIDQETVRVQPGVVLGQLNAQLASMGRCFGPDPANRTVTTMGSVVAVDAAGSHWLKHGSARQHIESLTVVLASGETVRLGQHDLEAPDPASPTAERLAERVAALIRANSALIDSRRARTLIDHSGYRLDDVLEGSQVHLARLMAGSEGTLSLITEATLRTVPLPRHSGVALLLFDRLEHAALAALEIPALGASACDLMDRRLLRLACESDVRYDLLLPEATEALLLVEFQGDHPRQVREGLGQIVHVVKRRKRLAIDAKLALEPDDVELFWRLVRRVVPTLYRLKGSTRPLPFVEDIAVPPSELPGFLVRLQNVFKKHQITSSVFGHVGHGQLHLRPFLDLADPDHVRRMQHLARDLYAEVMEVGGTISGEHADGLSRTWFLREQFGPLYAVFEQLKTIFDPLPILNPGKIIDQAGQSLTQNLRPVRPARSSADEIIDSDEPDAMVQFTSASKTLPIIPLELNWRNDDIMLAARACNGCGGCRTQANQERMCPIFRLSPAEEATPRAKANLMRALLNGRLDENLLKSDTLKQVADLCVNCHQCRLECPAAVDIPKLMLECKAQYVSNNGLTLSQAFLGRLDSVASWASFARPLSNWALRSPGMRWLLEKTLGIAQGRKLPRVAARSFLRQAARRRLNRPTRREAQKILYFVDVYANWFDPQLAEALVAIMEHNGISVFVPSQQLPSAMPLLTLGAVAKARKTVRRNVQMMSEAIRQGYHVVATEPSAALALTREYPQLLDDEDSQLVAQNSSEACSYLWRLHQRGHLELDLKPMNLTIGYHQPCHVRALQVGEPGENLLRLIPGVSVRTIEEGCSGMAGTFGLQRQNYRSSLRIGRGLITALRHPAIQIGSTECSACKLQMEQGTTKPTVHPLKLLALAYGLMPEMAGLLNSPGEERIAT